MMRHLSAFIDEPSALDAFAYRGFLFVLTFEGRLLQYDVAQLARDMQAEDDASGLAIAYALFSSKGIGAWPEMKNSWKGFDHDSSRAVRIRSAPINSHLVVEASAHLDMRVFYNQIFLATDLGTFRAPLGATGMLPDDRAEVERLLPEATESLSTGLGAVGASLGDEGLAVFTEVGAMERRPAIRVEVRSLRSSIGWGKMVNHPTHDSYEVLPSKVSQDSAGRRMLIGLSSPPDGAGDGQAPVDDSYALWDSGRLLVGNAAGIRSHGRFSGRRRGLAPSTDGATPLWLGATGNRCIVTETPERIVAARGNEHVVLHEGPAASVRTFNGSQRYKRLISSTVEGGLLLSAVFASDG